MPVPTLEARLSLHCAFVAVVLAGSASCRRGSDGAHAADSIEAASAAGLMPDWAAQETGSFEKVVLVAAFGALHACAIAVMAMALAGSAVGSAGIEAGRRGL